jgi:hypothetical protein
VSVSVSLSGALTGSILGGITTSLIWILVIIPRLRRVDRLERELRLERRKFKLAHYVAAETKEILDFAVSQCRDGDVVRAINARLAATVETINDPDFPYDD